MRRCRICGTVLGNRTDQGPVLAISVDETDDATDNPVKVGDPEDPRCLVHALPPDSDGG